MAEFSHHAECPECGSADNRAVYDDGSSWCFGCETYFKADGSIDNSRETVKAQPAGAGFIPDDKYGVLASRGGIAKATCEKYQYHVAKRGGTLCHVANYFDEGRNLVAQHVRVVDSKDFFWIGDSTKAQFFGQHLWRKGGKRITVTEGEIDALTLAHMFDNKWPVVSIPSGVSSAAKYFKRELEFFESYDEVILAFDDDEPGRQAVQKVAPLLTPGKVKVMSYSGCKDANELLAAGKLKELSNCFWNASPYRPDGIVSGEDLWDEVNAPPPKGFDIPYPELNTMCRGFRKGELHLFTAGSGIGKSTLIHEIGHHFLTVENHSLGVLALEDPKGKLGRRYLSIDMDVPLELRFEETTVEQRQAAFKNTIGSGRFFLYDHWGSTQIDALMSKLNYLAKGLDVDWILLDHISIVVSGLDEIGESERKVIDKLMTRLRALCENTGVGILAIVHLKRPPGQGKSFNNGREVSLTDLRGSGALEQLSDVVIALERDQQDADKCNFSRVRVLKNRPIGVTGIAGMVEYHPHTGRLLAADPEAEAFGGGDIEDDEFA